MSTPEDNADKENIHPAGDLRSIMRRQVAERKNKARAAGGPANATAAGGAGTTGANPSGDGGAGTTGGGSGDGGAGTTPPSDAGGSGLAPGNPPLPGGAPPGGSKDPRRRPPEKPRSTPEGTSPQQNPDGKKVEALPRFTLGGQPVGIHARAEGEAASEYAYIGQRNGWIELNAYSAKAEKWDWVAAYENQDKDVNDWIVWDWFSNLPYYSGGYLREGISIRFYRWQDGKYKELFRSGNLGLEAQVGKEAEGELDPGCYVSCTNDGYAVINWHGSNIQNWDWAGLFGSTADSDDNYKTYQWATKGSPYVTKEGFTAGQHIRYFRWMDGKYVCLRYSKPVCMYQLDLASIYNVPTDMLIVKRGATDYLAIMKDQLMKAFSREPSIFSPGFYPFGDNLLLKNLSVQEVAVILKNLNSRDYLDVLMIYYHTYRLAIVIADDGERNAKRHAFWQISLVRRFGEDFARKLGAAHEEGRPGSDLDNEVDEHNNEVSIAYAAENKEIEPKAAADYLWTTKRLRGYDIPIQSAADEMDVCPNFQVLFPN